MKIYTQRTAILLLVLRPLAHLPKGKLLAFLKNILDKQCVPSVSAWLCFAGFFVVVLVVLFICLLRPFLIVSQTRRRLTLQKLSSVTSVLNMDQAGLSGHADQMLWKSAEDLLFQFF